MTKPPAMSKTDELPDELWLVQGPHSQHPHVVFKDEKSKLPKIKYIRADLSRQQSAQSTGAGVDFDKLVEDIFQYIRGDRTSHRIAIRGTLHYLASQKLIGGGDTWWYEISDNTPRDRKILLAKIVPHFELSEPDRKGGLPNSKRDGSRVWWACTGSWSEKYKRWWDGIEPSGLADPTHWMDIPPLPSPPASTGERGEICR